MQQPATASVPTIGFTRSFAFGIPFWTIVEHGARERARELGATLTMRHCNNDSDMVLALHSLIQQHVDLIIVAAMDPDYPPFLAALAQASAAGIRLIAVDVPLPYPVDCLIRSDDLHGAADGAIFLAERLGRKGKVIHLQGEYGCPGGSAALGGGASGA